MNKYYSIKNSSDTKIIGRKYPQVKAVSSGYDLNSNNSVHALYDYVGLMPDFKPNLDSFILYNSSKLTDVISCSYFGMVGLLLSDKLKKILQKHKCVEHVYFKSSIIHEDVKHSNYYWFHIVNTDFIDYVDFSKMVFMNYKGLKIKDSKEFLKKINSDVNFIPTPNIIYLKNTFDTDLDLFWISPVLNSGIYISQQLKDAIEKEGVTGLDIEEAKDLIFLA